MLKYPRNCNHQLRNAEIIYFAPSRFLPVSASLIPVAAGCLLTVFSASGFLSTTLPGTTVTVCAGEWLQRSVVQRQARPAPAPAPLMSRGTQLGAGVSGAWMVPRSTSVSKHSRMVAVMLPLELLMIIRQSCTIKEKAPTRALSWLKALTSAFTFNSFLTRIENR